MITRIEMVSPFLRCRNWLRISTCCLLLASNLLLFAAPSKKSTVTRIDPTDWYVGLKDASLQLMVYGHGIAAAEVSTDYPSVKIDSLVRLDSPNYLLVYLNLEGAEAGEMTLNFKIGKKTEKYKYLLKNREKAGEERVGFSNADVLYMLMPDRFASGSTENDQIKGMNPYTVDRTKPSLRHGGDLEGIRQHLDYFNELGVTALWFTPVLENNRADEFEQSTYHGYATTDYYRVDPRFGTNAEYKQLIDEAHAKGLKVVMDMIFNHCGFDHPWIADLPAKDWLNLPEWLEQSKGTSDPRGTDFLQTSYKLTPVMDPYASQVDMKETVEGWFVPTMPDLNQKNPHVMKYLIQNSIWWVETAGIDGIRMDTYPYADRKGMAQWMEVLDREYPNFNTVGETWVTEPGYTASWQKDSKLSALNSHLKTVMDFAFFDRLDQARYEETNEWFAGLNRIYGSLLYDYLYPNPSSVMAFIENHDTDRFLKNGQDTLALKQALALLLTINRTPQLYYGTEILMNGTKEVSDGYVRKDFPGGFPGDAHNCFTAEGRSKEQQAMFTWLSRLLHWRQGNPCIIGGKQTQFIPWKGVYVIARQAEGRTALTILNGTSHDATFDASRYAEVIGQHATATNVITGEKIDINKNFTLTPRQTLIVEF